MNMLVFLIRLVTWMINGQQCKRENNKKLTQLEIKDDVILTILSFFSYAILHFSNVCMILQNSNKRKEKVK